MQPDERRPIGKTQILVSRLGIGGGSLANAAGPDGVASVIDRCWDEGLRYFDTAALYAAGESEIRLGEALARRERSEFVLSTKAGRYVQDGEMRFDFSRDGITRSIETSLTRLRMQRVDIAMIHDVDPDQLGERFEACFDEAMTGALPALEELRRAGKVGAIGVGVKDWRVCLRFAETGRFDCFMLAGGYTLLQQDSLPFLDYCAANAISVLVASPFNTGILATGAVEGARFFYRPAPEEVLERTRRIEAVCRRYEVALPAAALQFPLHHPAVASVVAGHQSPQEVADNLALLRRDLPQEFWEALAEVR
ncbi:D-threo-aldose 1-dehydrogenase [Rhizobiales bacterium GAS188]|nr:D-threo-aldose 1-dehydrogenase [Rhizobiales bacterium GAS188]